MDHISTELHISGMTCINCQRKIETALASLPGVKKVSVSYKKARAVLTYDPEQTSLQAITDTVRALDYDVLGQAEQTDFGRTFSFLAIIIALYVLLQQFGLLNLLVPNQLANQNMGYGMLFVVGLLTSVHCIAMCGGIHLSQCLPQCARDETNGKASFLPSIYYNLGRVISYTAIGAVLGLVGKLLGNGSNVGLPIFIQGMLKLIAGVLMVIMGINMLGIFPWMRRLTLRMPLFLQTKIEKSKAGERRPFIVGLLNGFMPCGPLQSIQIVALACASPLVGAISMFMFSLGTVPLMLGLGTIVSALGKKFSRTVMSVGAVFVAVLGLSMLSQGGSLSGMLSSDQLLYIVISLAVIAVIASIPVSKKSYRATALAASLVIVLAGGFLLQRADRNSALSNHSSVRIVDGVQMVESTLDPGQYPTIMVQSGMPVQWTIHAPKNSINGCNYKAIIQRFGIECVFAEGDNVIEFTPTVAETVDYTCWMGMIHGNIIITE